MKDILNAPSNVLNELFGIDGWDFYNVSKVGNILHIKFRKPYSTDEINFNEDGYKYETKFINPSNLDINTIKKINAKGFYTPYNFLSKCYPEK